MAYNRDPEQPIMDYEVDSFTWEDGLREIEEFDWSKDDAQEPGEASTANTTAGPLVGALPNTPGKPPVSSTLAPKKKVRYSMAGSEMDWEPTPSASTREAGKPIARQLFPSASRSANPLASGLGFSSNDVPNVAFEAKLSAPSLLPATSQGKGKDPVTNQDKGKAPTADKAEEQYVGPVTRGMVKASSTHSKTKTSSSRQSAFKPGKSLDVNQYSGPVTRGMKKASGVQSDEEMIDGDSDDEDSDENDASAVTH